jgi:CTP synthase
MGKHIFITGGVCSSLGKGIAAASIGSLLESRGYSIRMIKIDPYINVDAGTMNPYQHGEVYVTDDGAETDVDLGNYARFTNSPLSQKNSITTGQIYQEVIRKEREGSYLGGCVQVIPHVTNEIKRRIKDVGQVEESLVTIVEIGGTVGDIESIPFIEAARQFVHDLGRELVLFIHLTLIPTVSQGEHKTKPTQHAVKTLQGLGVQPDILLCRSSEPLSRAMKQKIALFTNVETRAVISAFDVKTSIYEIPLIFAEQHLDDIIAEKLGMDHEKSSLQSWERLRNIYSNATDTARVGIVGKYLDLHDSYKSIFEALTHGGYANRCKIELVKIDAEKLEKQKDMGNRFKDVDGILVPGGFGKRGIEGMVKAVSYARTNNIPCFGICMGMQTMVIEYARNCLNLKNSNSTEFNPDSEHPIIALMEEQKDVKNLGGTMRLGRMTTELREDSKIAGIYGSNTITERHRHRYEVSNQYRSDLQRAGLIISGTSPVSGLVETIEWSDHPWGIGVQFHPEFTSKPVVANPLFESFVKACLDHAKS